MEFQWRWNYVNDVWKDTILILMVESRRVKRRLSNAETRKRGKIKWIFSGYKNEMNKRKKCITNTLQVYFTNTDPYGWTCNRIEQVTPWRINTYHDIVVVVLIDALIPERLAHIQLRVKGYQMLFYQNILFHYIFVATQSKRFVSSTLVLFFRFHVYSLM